MNCYFVCPLCGIISGKDAVKNYMNWNDYHPNSYHIHTYSKFKHFEHYLSRSKYISTKLIEKMKDMFYKILEPFELICTNRKNFIRYEYVIIKFLGIFNQPVKRWRLPEGLKSITFSVFYNQPVEGWKLPEGLQSITFGYDFNQPVVGWELPEGLQSITFGTLFNQPVVGWELPAGLHLRMV